MYILNKEDNEFIVLTKVYIFNKGDKVYILYKEANGVYRFNQRINIIQGR